MGEGLEGTGTRIRQRLVPALRELGPLLAGLALIAAVGVGFAWSQRPGDPPTTGRAPASATVEEAPTGTVRGVVVGPDGEPVEGVVVKVVTAPFEPYFAGPNPASAVHAGATWSDTTGPDGTYEITRVAPGPHRVVVSPDGGDWATWWVGEAALADDAEDVQVEEDEVLRLDLTAMPAARIRGAVSEPFATAGGSRGETGETDGAVTEVVVERQTGDAWVEVARVRPGRAGRYEVDGLAAGQHRVLVDSPWSGIVHAPSATSEDDARVVELGVGQAAEVDVVVPPPALVTGRLTTSTGLPLTDREIRFSTGYRLVDPRFPALPTTTRSVRTDSEGRYAVRLGTGLWSVQTDLRCRGPQQREVDVVAGQDMTSDLVEDAVATVSGQVTDHAGRPLSGVDVFLSTPGSVCGQAATTDADGRWTLTSVAPGRARIEYAVTTRGSQLRYFHPGVTKPGLATRVEVALGATVTGVDADLP